MVAPRALGVGVAAGLACLAACGPPPQPKQMPPQAVSQQSPDPPPPSDPAPSAPPKSDSVVMVDKGGEADPKQTLAEASRAEKERRQGMGKPTVVINDKNLAQYAAKGQITTAKPADTGAAKAAPTQNLKGGHDEAYWLARGREIRQRWHDAAEARQEQQKSVERLRTAFYAEDDPYVRDGRIKPEWDRALEKLEQSRRDIDRAKKDLDAFMDEGQRAGAYQAWLEEGIDLEPAQEAVKPKPNEPGEPKVIEPANQEPPPHA